MEADTFTYGLLSLLISGALWSYYRLFLAGKRHFKLNRLVLMASVAFAVIVPGLVLKLELPFLETIGFSYELPQVEIIGPATKSRIGLNTLLYGFLILGMLFRALLLLVRFLRIRLSLSKLKTFKLEGQKIALTGGEIPTSSFGNWIFWDETRHGAANLKSPVFMHEQCHVKEKHSWDIMLLELLRIPLWFNPFLFLIQKSLTSIHEYSADQAALQATSRDAYRRMLFDSVYPGMAPVLSHSFFHSPLKQRIMMFSKNSAPKSSTLSYWAILPLCFLLFSAAGLFANPQLPTSIETSVKSGEPDKFPQATNMAEVIQAIGYPAAAKDNKVEGKVVVKLLVGKSGKVKKHEVLKTLHPALDNAVVKNIYDLKFTPGEKNGKKVSVWLTLPVKFELPQ